MRRLLLLVSHVQARDVRKSRRASARDKKHASSFAQFGRPVGRVGAEPEIESKHCQLLAVEMCTRDHEQNMQGAIRLRNVIPKVSQEKNVQAGAHSEHLLHLAAVLETRWPL